MRANERDLRDSRNLPFSPPLIVRVRVRKFVDRNFEGMEERRDERQRGVCDLLDRLRANNVILRACGRRRGRERRRRRNPAGRARRERTSVEIHSRKGEAPLFGRDDVYTPLEPLRQHVLLDYRLKLSDRGRSRERRVFRACEILFAIFIEQSERKSNSA